MVPWRFAPRIADIVLGILLLALSAFGFWRTMTWVPPVMPGDPGAAFFPRLSMAIVSIFALVLLVRRMMQGRPRAAQGAVASENERGSQAVTVDGAAFLTALVSSGLLVAGIGTVGFEISAFLFVFVLLGWRSGRWVWSVIVSVITTVFLYVVFVLLLKVQLPLAFLPKYVSWL